LRLVAFGGIAEVMPRYGSFLKLHHYRQHSFHGSSFWRGVESASRVIQIIGQISAIEIIASGRGIRERRRLRKIYGNSMKRTVPQFVVCVENKGYAASLELLKLYPAIADEVAAKLHQIRVIDESGEDYLYPEEYFVPVQFPQAAEKVVRRAHPQEADWRRWALCG